MRNKKIVSIYLILTMLAVLYTSTVFTYAIGKSTQQSNPILEKTYQMYVKNCKDVTIVKKTFKRYIYKLKVPTKNGHYISSLITATINKKGNQVLNIQENGKHDQLIITKKNKLYLNKKAIKIEKQIQSKAEIQSELMAQRMYWSKKCPYGKSSSYTKSWGTVKKKFTLSKPIAEVAFAIIVAIIAKEYTIYEWVQIAVGGAASGIKSWFGRNSPEANAWSMKDTIKVHKTKGLNVSLHMSVQKHSFIYYAKTNFTKKIGTSSRFKIWSYQ